MKNKHFSLALGKAIGTTFALSIASTGMVNAEENPFSMTTLEQGYQVAVDTSEVADKAKEMVKDALTEDAPGRDSEGNPVNFNYGGDSKGTYADGKVGTGVKDPGVCGTFTGERCGADGGSHLK